MSSVKPAPTDPVTFAGVSLLPGTVADLRFGGVIRSGQKAIAKRQLEIANHKGANADADSLRRGVFLHLPASLSELRSHGVGEVRTESGMFLTRTCALRNAVLGR